MLPGSRVNLKINLLTQESAEDLLKGANRPGLVGQAYTLGVYNVPDFQQIPVPYISTKGAE